MLTSITKTIAVLISAIFFVSCQDDRFPRTYNGTELKKRSDGSLEMEILNRLDVLLDQLDNIKGSMTRLKQENHIMYRTLKRLNTQFQDNSKILSMPPQKCPDDFDYSEQFKACYLFEAKRVTWRTAQESCQAKGSNLISIRNAKEQNYVMDSAMKRFDIKYCDFWGGATDQERDGHWVWTATKKILGYTNWHVNEPNNDQGNEHCMLMMWVFRWAWNDARCHQHSACYICQILL